MGLAESGKTTITKFPLLNLLNHSFPTKDERFHATIDYERHKLAFGDKEIEIFDLGGMTSFLERFTGQLAEFIFLNVKAFVFIVDSIEIKNVSWAKYFFDLALKQLTRYSPMARIFVFQHKSDLVPKHMRAEVRNTIEEYIVSGTKHIIRENPINYYETSVFTSSIIQAIDGVMSWMLDGELYLYHQYLQNQDREKDFEKEREQLKKRNQNIPEEITYRDEFGKLKKRLVPKKGEED